jgi:hypothetical protein
MVDWRSQCLQELDWILATFDVESDIDNDEFSRFFVCFFFFFIKPLSSLMFVTLFT